MSDLKPWRAVIAPRPEIVDGRERTFTLDLSGARGTAEAFLARTAWTAGLKGLCEDVARRLLGGGGEAITELQGRFGGGKTHALLTLVHLFGAGSPCDDPEVAAWVKDAGLVGLPEGVRHAVLVGTALGPGQAEHKPDGTEVHTLWGELAWQLGGAEAYGNVAESDKRAVSPGAGLLSRILADAAPCVVLVDEWVAYARQTVGRRGLSGGDFEVQASFIQALSEAVRVTPEVALVITVPESEAEIGGEHGQRAAEALREVIRRVGARRVTGEPADRARVVHKRLFETIGDPSGREAVVEAFAEMVSSGESFPEALAEPGEAARRLRNSYPFHPSLFETLAGPWSDLDGFQGTRGLLRVLAAMLRALWFEPDSAPLIMAGGAPLGSSEVRGALLRALDTHWAAVLDADVVGSLADEIGEAHPALADTGMLHRAARALFLSSAPDPRAWTGPRPLRWACALPGEPPPRVDDAARHLAQRATYLHEEGERHRFETRPSPSNLARCFGEAPTRSALHDTVLARLTDTPTSAPLKLVVGPRQSGRIRDERRARLVVLGPWHPHSAEGTSRALSASQDMVAGFGDRPRRFQNSLLFLAFDEVQISTVERAARRAIGWAELASRAKGLKLSERQTASARDEAHKAEASLDRAINLAWCWLLSPWRPDPGGPIEWEVRRVPSPEDALVESVNTALREALLVQDFGGERLAMELEAHFWPHRAHVSLNALGDAFSAYTYLPRLQTPEVLLDAVIDGLSMPSKATFAIARAVDPETGQIEGLRRTALRDTLAPSTLLVHADLLGEAENPAEPRNERATEAPTRFKGQLSVAPEHLSEAVADLQGEILSLLEGLPGSVRVSLVVEAESLEGLDAETLQALKENCRTLGMGSTFSEEDPGGD